MTALRCALHRRRPDRPSRHAVSCLRCQATESRHRQLMRALRELRDAEEPAPDHLVRDVLAALDFPEPEVRPGRKAAIAGGTAVAIAAAAAIAVRTRRAAA